jgi:hypothetical protein
VGLGVGVGSGVGLGVAVGVGVGLGDGLGEADAAGLGEGPGVGVGVAGGLVTTGVFVGVGAGVPGVATGPEGLGLAGVLVGSSDGVAVASMLGVEVGTRLTDGLGGLAMTWAKRAGGRIAVPITMAANSDGSSVMAIRSVDRMLAMSLWP